VQKYGLGVSYHLHQSIFAMHKLLFLSFGICICTTGCQQAPVKDTSFSFRPGTLKSFRVSIQKESTTAWEYNGQPHSSNGVSEIVYHLSVLRAKDSMYEIQLRFEAFKLKKLKTNTYLPSPDSSGSN
jgi:hypothetical protein